MDTIERAENSTLYTTFEDWLNSKDTVYPSLGDAWNASERNMLHKIKGRMFSIGTATARIKQIVQNLPFIEVVRGQRDAVMTQDQYNQIMELLAVLERNDPLTINNKSKELK